MSILEKVSRADGTCSYYDGMYFQMDGNPNFRNSKGIVQRCGGQFQGSTTYNSITFGMIWDVCMWVICIVHQ